MDLWYKMILLFLIYSINITDDGCLNKKLRTEIMLMSSDKPLKETT